MVTVKEEKVKQDLLEPGNQDLLELDKQDLLEELDKQDKIEPDKQDLLIPELLEADKQLESHLYKCLFEQLCQSIQEANLSSLRAVELIHQLLADKNLEDTKDCFSEVSTPLMKAVESLGITLIAAQSIGKTYYGIAEESKLDPENDSIKKEFPAKIENDEDLDDYNDDYFMDTDHDDLIQDPTIEYKCDICDYSTAEARYLKQHKKTHGAGKYLCIKCDYTSHKLYILKAHIHKIHQIKKIEFICDRENPEIKHFLCQLCHYTNTDCEAVTSHTQRKHIKNGIKPADSDGDDDKVKLEDLVEEEFDPSDVGNEYKCTRCDYIAKKKIYFEDHMSGGLKFVKCPWCDAHFKHTAKGKLGRHLTSEHAVIKVDSKWKCEHCENDFEKIRDLIHHLAKIHNFGTMLHCHQCDFSSVDRRNLVVHAEFHNTADFPCTQCDYMAKSKNRLRKHIYSAHKQTECSICHRSFKNMQEYFNHSKSHHGTRPVCDTCGKSFSCGGALGTHMKAMHGDEKMQCEKCDFTTHNMSSLNYHISTRHKGEIFYCDTCDYNTPRKGNLTAHIKNKHQNIKYTCDVCDMKFTTNVAMKRHKKIKHSTDLVKYSCEEGGCSYTTHTLYFLKTHVEKVHKGIRWPCDLCDYVGGYKGDLNRHKKIVHQGFVLECSVCGFKTPKKYHLKEHMLKEHGLDEVS